MESLCPCALSASYLYHLEHGFITLPRLGVYLYSVPEALGCIQVSGMK